MHHVVIGAGPAGMSAIETIRHLESEPSRITLVCDEPAHSRMVLPYWLSGHVDRAHTQLGDARHFTRLNVDTRFGRRVASIAPDTRTLGLDDGTAITYDTLLIATGSRPVAPPIPGVDLPGVQPMWSLRHVDGALATMQSVASPRALLVGAGFVGLIVLGAMFKRNWSLTVVEQEPHVLPRMLDPDAARIVQTWLTDHGIAVHTSTTVDAIQQGAARKQVGLRDGSSLDADLVVLATGVQPNVDVARATGIQTDQGILVDDRMRTSIPGIFAAGDVAQGPALLSDLQVVHAIQPTAVDHGRVAGANMAGREVHYPGSLGMNVLDACGLQCASYGDALNRDRPTIVVTDRRRFLYRKLVWEDDRLVGAIVTGKPADVGMLTDLGMLKGLIQTQVPMGIWKSYLTENPFDVRRAFVALGVGARLARFALLGRPATGRGYRFHAPAATPARTPHHALFFDTGEPFEDPENS